MQNLEIDDSLRRQSLGLDESLRLQESRYDEAGRIQGTKMGEALRLQQARFGEQQRQQEADAMGREYQFRVAETREQNRLNRLHNMATQSVQTRADLEASELAAKAQRDGAISGAITGAAEAGLAYYAGAKKTSSSSGGGQRQIQRPAVEYESKGIGG